MNNHSAEKISRTLRGYKFLTGLLKRVDKAGTVVVPFGNTGADLTVTKDDAFYYKLQTTRASLREELASYEIVKQISIPIPETPTAELPDEVISVSAETGLPKRRRRGVAAEVEASSTSVSSRTHREVSPEEHDRRSKALKAAWERRKANRITKER